MDYLEPDMMEEKQEVKVKPVVIYGGPLYDGKGNVYEDGSVYIKNGKVALIGSEEEVFGGMDKNLDVEVIDTQGKVIFPGLINAHHHFYSAFAKGLAPFGPVLNFQDRLKNLWWKLDKSLDKEAVQLSTMVSLMDCIRAGVTTVFDHHSSPMVIEDSLDGMAVVIKQVGLQALLCHEISDRNGKKIFQQQLQENLSFIEKYQNDPDIKGILGLHANFTLSENSLKIVENEIDDGVGIHIHCAEDICDQTYCNDLGYKGCIHRLNKHNLINKKSILAHGLHLTENELTTLSKSGALLVHNPESNANNNVGRLKLPLPKDILVGLGTDGFTSDMFHSLRAAFISHRQAGTEESVLFNRLPKYLLENNSKFAARYFNGRPGVLEKGSKADVAVFDYVPYTLFHENNITGHMLFGMYNSRATLVITGGKIIYKDGTFFTLDEKLILDESKKVSRKVWERYVEV